jgi:predicted ABC-type ATPase
MNVDRLPDGGDDDRERPVETPRSTEPAPPETPPPPEASQPKEDSPAPEKPESTENTVQANDSPEAPDAAAQPPGPREARETAEPRSRQEHAEPALDVAGRQTQRQSLTDESRSRVESSGRHETAFDLDPRNLYDDSVKPDGEAAEGFRPRTQQERAEHITDVFARLDKADDEGLSSNELHTIDPKGEIWSSDRTLLHQALLDEIYSRAADVPCDHEAIVAGGLSGAGKTTVLSNHPEIDRSNYLTINPDNLKEEMARRGMIPEVEGLSPMEASELVHEESSYLARQLAIRAQADGKNLIWDITMSDQTKTERRITDLREAGYTKVDALFVQIPIETSLRRTESRYWADQDKWFSGEGFGGRLIPPEVILRQADEEWGSGNRKTFEALKGIVNNWEIKDNSIDGCSATLVDRSKAEEVASSKREEQEL